MAKKVIRKALVKKKDNKDPRLVELGLKISTLRKNVLKLNQEDFSASIPLHRTFVSGIEAGSRNPSYLTLVALAEALNMTVSEMLE